MVLRQCTTLLCSLNLLYINGIPIWQLQQKRKDEPQNRRMNQTSWMLNLALRVETSSRCFSWLLIRGETVRGFALENLEGSQLYSGKQCCSASAREEYRANKYFPPLCSTSFLDTLYHSEGCRWKSNRINEINIGKSNQIEKLMLGLPQ